MKRFTLLKTMLLLCALIVGSGNAWAQTVLFHETFGDNSGSARDWTSNYSVKTGVPSVCSNVSYTVTAAKQSKNTMGQTKSALVSNQAASGTLIIGPLCVSAYSSLKVTNYFGMSSKSWDSAHSYMKLSYSTDNSLYTEVEKTGNNPSGAVSSNKNFVQASYTLPAEATSDNLYLKFEFYCYQLNTKNVEIGQVYLDEVELQYIGEEVPPSTPSSEVASIPVCTMSIATCTYSNKTWTNNDNNAYTLGNGDTDIPSKDYGGINRIKLDKDKTFNITVPSGVAVNKVEVTGASATSSPTSVTIGGITKSFLSLGTDVFTISTPAEGVSISIAIGAKEFGLESIVLYTADGKTLTTTDNMDGWRAFYDATQDYEVDANTKIYVAAWSETANKVTLTKVDKTKIRHGEAVILKTSAGDHKMVLTKTTGAESLGANVLTVTDGLNNVDGYRMGYGEINGEDKVGFFKYTTTTAPAAGIVYIDKSNVNASGLSRGLSISFADDETTGITTVEKTDNTDNAAQKVYNLNGQRIMNPTKGLYIVNGKKVIIK